MRTRSKHRSHQTTLFLASMPLKGPLTLAADNLRYQLPYALTTVCVHPTTSKLEQFLGRIPLSVFFWHERSG